MLKGVLIYNTLSRKKERFLPKGCVKIYVCGLTPYDSPHIGHGRCYVFFDVVRRFLEKKGYKVLHVQNFTDIDDKIIDRAEREGVPPKDIAQRYIDEYFSVMDALGVRRAHFYPKVTEHLDEIIESVKRLLKRGYAYKVEADVYFDTSKLPQYGSFSLRKREDLASHHRIKENPKKKSPLDFALWKEDKEWGWLSPFGKGRPGWHIECTVLSKKYLGSTFHIHGGGQDLIFPHHENEIAQSVALEGKGPARVWMHVQHLTVRGEKMSKSLGNVVSLSSLLKRWSPSVVRLYLLLAHYRSPQEFDERGLREAAAALERMEAAASRMCTLSAYTPSELKTDFKELKPFVEEFIRSMEDDFNTPSALACLFKVCNRVHKAIQRKEARAKELVKEGWSFYKMVDDTLGIFSDRSLDTFRLIKSGVEYPVRVSEIERLLIKRGVYREQKKYKEADKIRKELEKSGIIIDDYPEGSVWRRKRLA